MSDIYKEKREQIRKQIITTKEIQKWLNITRQRVSDFVREGRLTPICRGIFLRDEVEDFIRKRQRERYSVRVEVSFKGEEFGKGVN